ncbi:MaoC/PaaZ C-terminal domain-containing protein [Glutamicibacter sp.]|uniref:MaoC/PaaZ C-terminal domain-containing protein n=1 Tax=Glutamicibacter sp. TaxID=1931995 RepID=UPI002B4758A4|nr:MaoC/PaaZ C-terminal domain-containing protein [Glutamicibacter sp.]HJX79405.1 MaoC/PaaZ C-terminal domain-containing protein [Glutamicibacter sp.]
MTSERNEAAGTSTASPKGRPDHHWDALVEGDLIHSAGMTITDAHLVNWAGLTGDLVSLHLDETYAAETQFGQRIAHGPLTLSLALGLMTQTGYFSNVIAWLGLDAVRAHNPVFIGDTIHVEARVATARESKKPGVGIWSIEYTVLKQDDTEVMTFNSSFMIKRK